MGNDTFEFLAVSINWCWMLSGVRSSMQGWEIKAVLPKALKWALSDLTSNSEIRWVIIDSTFADQRWFTILRFWSNLHSYSIFLIHLTDYCGMWSHERTERPSKYARLCIARAGGRVTFELFVDTTPKTAENFRGLPRGWLLKSNYQLICTERNPRWKNIVPAFQAERSLVGILPETALLFQISWWLLNFFKIDVVPH